MSAAHAAGVRPVGLSRAARAATAVGPPASPPAPLVAVLCAEPRARVAAAGVALAASRATGHRLALAGGVGVPAGTALVTSPASRRAASAARRRGAAASASGRLVWLADRRGAPAADDAPARCAAVGAELGRAAAALGVPAAVAYPFARTDALDRVLAWHDAIVVVREPDAPSALIEQALASLAGIRRPVAAMAVPSRMSGTLAVAGLAVPAEAAAAVAELMRAGLGGRGDADA